MDNLVGLMGEPLAVGDRVLYNPDPKYYHSLYRDYVGKILTITRILSPERQILYFGNTYVRGPMRLLEFKETPHCMYDARFLKVNRDYKADQEPLEDEECL